MTTNIETPAYEYGYARVSSTGQDLTRQIKVLTKAGIPDNRIYTDKVSGKSVDGRAGLDALLAVVRPGDVITLDTIDRLGRNLTDTLGLLKSLTDRNIHVVAIGDKLDTRDESIGAVVTRHVLLLMADLERRFMLERVAKARAAGKTPGRPRKAGATGTDAEIQESFRQGLTSRQVMEKHGISRATAFRIKAKMGESQSVAVADETPAPPVEVEEVVPVAVPVTLPERVAHHISSSEDGFDGFDIVKLKWNKAGGCTVTATIAEHQAMADYCETAFYGNSNPEEDERKDRAALVTYRKRIAAKIN